MQFDNFLKLHEKLMQFLKITNMHRSIVLDDLFGPSELNIDHRAYFVS